MINKRLVIASAVIALLLATLAFLWPRNRIFLQAPHGRYEVLSARYAHGTNMTVSTFEDQAKGWFRRQLDRVGIHTKGSRGGSDFSSGVGIHAIALICRGSLAADDLAQVDAECVTDSGQTVRLNHRITKRASAGRFLLVYFYTDDELTNLHMFGFANSPVTNFSPRRLSFFRTADHQKLGTLDLSH